MSKDVQLPGFTHRLGVRHRYVESALLLLDGKNRPDLVREAVVLHEPLPIRRSVDDEPELLFGLVPHSASQASRGLILFGAVPVGAIPASFTFPDEMGACNCRIPPPASCS